MFVLVSTDQSQLRFQMGMATKWDRLIPPPPLIHLPVYKLAINRGWECQIPDHTIFIVRCQTMLYLLSDARPCYIYCQMPDHAIFIVRCQTMLYLLSDARPCYIYCQMPDHTIFIVRCRPCYIYCQMPDHAIFIVRCQTILYSFVKQWLLNV